MVSPVIQGKWYGYYTYLEGYADAWLGLKVFFEAEIIETNAGFSGKITEDVSSGGVDDLATIKGKIYQNKLAFKKEYSKAFYAGREGDSYSVEGDAPVPISYFGRYDEVQERFSGEWIILSSITNIGSEEFTQCSGAWEMRREHY